MLTKQIIFTLRISIPKLNFDQVQKMIKILDKITTIYKLASLSIVSFFFFKNNRLNFETKSWSFWAHKTNKI